MTLLQRKLLLSRHACPCRGAAAGNLYVLGVNSGAIVPNERRGVKAERKFVRGRHQSERPAPAEYRTVTMKAPRLKEKASNVGRGGGNESEEARRLTGGRRWHHLI